MDDGDGDLAVLMEDGEHCLVLEELLFLTLDDNDDANDDDEFPFC